MERKGFFFLLFKAGSPSTLQQTSLCLCNPSLFPSHSPDLGMGTQKTSLSRGAEVVAALLIRYLAQPCLSNSREFPDGTTGSTTAVHEDLYCLASPRRWCSHCLCAPPGMALVSLNPWIDWKGMFFTAVGGVHAWKFQVAAPQRPLCEREEHLGRVWQL